MGKLSRSSKLSRSNLSKNSITNNEGKTKTVQNDWVGSGMKQSKISNYFKITPKKQEHISADKVSSPSEPCNNLNSSSVNVSSKPVCFHTTANDNFIEGKEENFPMPKAEELIDITVSDGSDAEIIECTPDASRKKTDTFFKLTSECESPEIIPPTPMLEKNISLTIPYLSKINSGIKFRSLVEPRLRSNRSKLSKLSVSKPSAAKSLKWQSKDKMQNEIGGNLKRSAETGVGVSPNAKKQNDEHVPGVSESCKFNILEKFDSLNPSEKFYSGSDSSCSFLQSGVLNTKIYCDNKKNFPIGILPLNKLEKHILDEKQNLTSATIPVNDLKKINSTMPDTRLSDQMEDTVWKNESSCIYDSDDSNNHEVKSKLYLDKSSNNHTESKDLPATLTTPEKNAGVNKEITKNNASETTEIPLQHSGTPSKPENVSNKSATTEDSLGELLALNFDAFSPFKDIRKQPAGATKDIEKLLSEGLGNMSFASKGNYGRYIVVSVQKDVYQREMLLHLKSPLNGSSKLCSLKGFWYESRVKEADIVHILFTEEQEDKFVISNEKGIIVINPDLLISGTSVVSGVFCHRKAVLSERFKGYETGNKVMIIGSVVHQLFQEVVRGRHTTSEQINSLIKRLVTQPQVLKDLYGLRILENDFVEEISKFAPMIRTWCKTYMNADPVMNSDDAASNWRGRISAVKDIEENIWSPRFGLKGKIDLTVETNKFGQTKIVPLELKTGKASYSSEHKGQVTLYSMMMADRRQDPLGGLLLYLRDGSMAEVPAGEKEKRALIQLRNELAQFLSQQPSLLRDESYTLPSLPEHLSNERWCAKCAHLTTCSVLQRLEGDCFESSHPIASLISRATEHLSQNHFEYFRRWCLMLHLEIGVNSSESSIRSLWCMDATHREMSGSSLIDMTVDNEVEDISNGYFCHKMRRASNSPYDRHLPRNFQVGESVVVSSDKELALSLGVVYSVETDSLTVVLDRNLHRSSSSVSRIYTVDRCEYQNTMSIFFTNLAVLFANTDRSKRLRELIIDLKSPEFTKGIDRKVVQLIRDILVLLNKEQQRAVLRSLLANDYSVLKGFPGTGKTSTIIGLVRVLHTMGHSVLLTSYTHSAVDNILLKLKNFEGIKFLRLGKASRIHKDLLQFSDGVLTKNLTSLNEIEQFYDSFNIVGTTCLGVAHPIFKRKTFDFCIIDEASQVLEMAALGPLFFCARFILVGDSLQLPPVVKSQSAKSLGMVKSLFERLDSESATVCLTLQYRMNGPIMDLANRLIYEGKLKCASDALETATLSVSLEIYENLPVWLHRITSPNIQDSALFVDTLTSAPEGKNCSGQPINEKEAQVIKAILQTFCMLGIDRNEVGVITPYRAQVKLLHQMASNAKLELLEINTVDQFQGRDKSVILYSCVRSGLRQEDVKKSEILNDVRRLNVAITRAKHKLVIVGDLQTLRYFGPFQTLLGTSSNNSIYELRQGVEGFSWDELPIL